MKLKNYLLLLLISSTTAFGQSLTNQLVIGGNGDDNIQLHNLKDGSGYYLFGSSTSNLSGSKSENLKGTADYWLVKTDNQFNILWDKSIGGTNFNGAWDALPHDNGVYIIGTSNSNASGDKTMDSYGDEDIWLLNVSHEGHINWQAQYGGDMYELYPRVIDFTDTSLLVVSCSASGVSGNKTVASKGSVDIWLLEVSKIDGRIVQQRVYGTEGPDVFTNIARNPYNNHLYMSAVTVGGISGDKSEYGYGVEDVWIVELDEELNIVREKVFGGSSLERSPGSFLFVGEHIYIPIPSQSGVSGNKTTPSYNALGSLTDLWLLKLNSELDIVWDKSYGGNNSETLGGLFALPNGNLVLTANSKSIVTSAGNLTTPTFGVTYSDVWMVVLTEDGDIIYQERFGGSLDEYGALHKGNNNEYVLCASSRSPISGVKTVPSFGGSDAWIGTIDLERILNVTAANQELLSVFPNPVVNELTIQGNYQGKNYKIINMNGKVMASNQIINSQSTIDVSFLQAGLYILQLEEKQFKFSKR